MATMMGALGNSRRIMGTRIRFNGTLSTRRCPGSRPARLRAQLAELGGVADATVSDFKSRSQHQSLLVHGPQQRVGIEDLLEQSGPRAREPYDEDRTVIDARTAVTPSCNILWIAARRRERPVLGF